MDQYLTLLLRTLDNLKSNELKRFRMYLQHQEGCDSIPAASLENCCSTDIVDKMIGVYGETRALEVTVRILRQIQQNDLAEKLEKQMEETQASTRKRSYSLTPGEPFAEPWKKTVPSLYYSGSTSGPSTSYDDSDSVLSSIPARSGGVAIPPSFSITSKRPESFPFNSDDTTIKKTSKQNKMRLQSTEDPFEGTEDQKKPLHEFYTELYITDGVSEDVKTQHEVRQMEIQSRRESSTQDAIDCNDIFKPSPEPGIPIRTVMTKGIAGIGKSVTVQKFILDWREGRANQDIDFIFMLPFRQLNLYINYQYSLHGLLLEFHPELREIHNLELFDEVKIVFILDGLDESKFRLKFRERGTLSQIKETSSVDMLIVNLLKKNLLPSASIWVTSRPAAAHQIPRKYIDRWTEIHGFKDQQKEHYFRNKIKDQIEADRIVKQIRDSRSLYIMCRIPVFCWILATVLKRMGTRDKGDIPKTLTEIFAHFLLIQLTRKEQKNEDEEKEEKDTRQVLKSNKDVILKLAELAYRELEKDNVLFSEEDLKECKIDLHQDMEKSGMCTEVFVSETVIFKKKVYCFVHLSVQEFLAALFVFHSFSSGNFEVLKSFAMEGQQLHDLLKSAVRKSLQSQNGHLDLFLRFLLGISLEPNQKLFEGLLTPTQESSESVKMTVQYIKETFSRHGQSTERCMNLLLCLLELKDCSLHEEVQGYVQSGELLSPAVCSTLAYMMLVSEDTQDEFDLMKFSTTDKGRMRLVIAVRNCKKGRLVSCGLNKDSCETITSALQSDNSPVEELNLSCNDLRDAGVQMLSQGLNHANCILATLRLASCNLTGDSCKTLALVLQASDSHLRELDLTNNDIAAAGVQELSPALSHPNCKLHTLILAGCNLTGESCRPLAASLRSGNSHLRHLDLTNNDLGEPGLGQLSATLGHQDCKLEILKLSGCLVSERACELLASVLTSKPTSLKELDLTYNHTGASAVSLRSKLQREGCKLNIDSNAQRWMKPSLQKYACELTLDISTAHPELVLSENNQRVTRVEEDQPYPDHRQRFDCCPQLLCLEGLTGRHYWEAEWKGSEVVIGAAYPSIRRKTHGANCKIGLNTKSYGLWCEDGHYVVRYDINKTDLTPACSGFSRVGLYLDWPAGTLSFYAVSSGKLTHLHTFHSRVGDPPRPGFSEPLYPGFWLHRECTASLCQVK